MPLFLKLSSRYTPLQYPYDILVLSAVYVIGNVMFFVFYTKPIAYSVHLIICRMSMVIYGMLTMSTLYLCPQTAFNKMESISRALMSAGYLIGSALGPILFTVHHQLPFMVIAALNSMLVIVIVAVYVYRKRILSAKDFDDDIKEQYLLMERVMNDHSKSMEEKEMNKLELFATLRMLNHQITATDLVMG